MTKLYGLIFKYCNMMAYYSTILLGITMFTWFFYTKFILIRIPKSVPLDLTEIRFYIMVYVCIIYLYIVKSLLFPKEPNIYVKKLMEYVLYPLKTFDTAWKTSYLLQPYYMTIMSNFISYLESTNTFFRHLLFISFQIIPRIILILILIMDIFYFRELSYIYKFVFLALFPLLYRYIKYSLKSYTDHLIIFAKKDYDYIEIHNVTNLFFPDEDPNPEAIYDNKNVSIEEYIEIVYENILYIRNFDLAFYIKEFDLPSDTEYSDIKNNIKYVGQGKMKEKTEVAYASRFFNKVIKDPILDLTNEERSVLLEEFEFHYKKIFILKDIIPQNDEVTNKAVYRYIRAYIFIIYFRLWLYLIIISYCKIPDFVLTKIILNWLILYIENVDPFSGINILDDSFSWFY